MWAELDSHPENFEIDENDFTITRKATAPAPKPSKTWDPVNERWVQKLGKLVTPYERNQTGGNYERKNIPTRIYI
jgi:hypothetical protein